jgi:hypothetical protein
VSKETCQKRAPTGRPDTEKVKETYYGVKRDLPEEGTDGAPRHRKNLGPFY